eukprot:gene12508-16672_t
MSIRSGCSGAAIFNEQVGLIGMVVENQENVTGLIVPIQIIRQVIDLPVSAAAIAAAPATSSGTDWSRRFRQFDRRQPVADFADLLGRRWKKESRGFDALLALRKVDIVTFSDWKKIEEAEIARARDGAPREKCSSFREVYKGRIMFKTI